MEMKVVSLFSGGGGLDLGFISEGYQVIWAIDNNRNAVDTYKANIGDHIICADINEIDITKIPHADVVIGGPPCQSFSLAGNRNVEDERGQLVWKYIRIIEQVNPRAFVFENVTGLLSAKNANGEKIIDLLKEAFRAIGYTIALQVLNAVDYGVPQRRHRVIIVGLQKGEFQFPEPTHCEDGHGKLKYVSVSEALGDLPPAIEDENGLVRFTLPPQNDYQKRMRTADLVSEHFIPQMSKLDRYIVAHVKPGGNYMDIPQDVDSKRIRRLQREGGHTTCYGRMAPDQPSYTINTYFNRPNVGCNIHYGQERLITVREALRLQSFPDSYTIVSGSKQGRNLIVGNAVPPMLAAVIARELKKHLCTEVRRNMWISYSDSEVNTFHPICERALNRALKLSGKDGQYQVLHHQYTGALEMDFAVRNIHTGKYLCVVEVKRTPADVHSTRYQFQAMSYVQMNADESEKPFYILTNLEYAFSFRYDPDRPRAFQQMLKPGLSAIGSFIADGETEFEEKLTEYFRSRIEEYYADSYEYLVTLEEFAAHMERIKEHPRKWKSHLAVLLYEYIRGAFTFLGRDDLRDIRLFRGDVAKICDEAVKVNFKDIFLYSDDKFEKNYHIKSEMLTDLFDFGNQNINGDSIAGILHQIVSEGREHDGEVPTDMELARIVAYLAKQSSGELGKNELLCDPAAGSWNLISAAIPLFRLEPAQMIANDVNPKLLELLSLRLGLNYARIIGTGSSPAVYNRDLVDLDGSFFEKVKVIVLNPPFVAGINCVERKQKFYKRIKELRQKDADTLVGLMPLEAIFLELLTLLVRPGTTIACVFPKTHLMARGMEAKVIRRLILDNLGLQTVFTYPGDEIFDEVTKGTCILVGKAMQKSDAVTVISSYEKIPDIDIHRFSAALYAEREKGCPLSMPGLTAKKVPASELSGKIEDGWRMLNNEMAESVEFVKTVFHDDTGFKRLSEYGFPMKRGSAGNNGGSDILFFDSRADLYERFKDSSVKLGVGMRNAKLDCLDIEGGDSAFLDVSINEETLVDRIIEVYNSLPARAGRQQRKAKGKAEWMKILCKESGSGFDGNSVLIPRGIRTTGRVYLSRKPVFVSTNFVVCTLPSLTKAILLSTWMSTVFYQLICEVSSKDQEGMRKMEVMDIGYTFVPDLDFISEETTKRLSEESQKLVFLNLNKPEIREVDRIWAAELFGDKAAENLNCALRLLDYQVNRRNPG